jgi:hypothetical protein
MTERPLFGVCADRRFAQLARKTTKQIVLDLALGLRSPDDHASVRAAWLPKSNPVHRLRRQNRRLERVAGRRKAPRLTTLGRFSTGLDLFDTGPQDVISPQIRSSSDYTVLFFIDLLGLVIRPIGQGYIYLFAGVMQFGRKALDTILAAWPLVALAVHRKYGRLCGSQGSLEPPHWYPLITPCKVSRSIQSQ